MDHVSGPAGNLMLASISPSTTDLTTGQAGTILASAIEQFDGAAFIRITPVLIVATPEPAAAALLLLGLLGLARVTRRS